MSLPQFSHLFRWCNKLIALTFHTDFGPTTRNEIVAPISEFTLPELQSILATVGKYLGRGGLAYISK